MILPASVFFLVSLVAVMFLIRNQCVYRYRMTLLGQISTAAQADIAHGAFTNWARRYDTMYTVSYDQMMWRFWRPLKAFYTDTQMHTMVGPGPAPDWRNREN